MRKEAEDLMKEQIVVRCHKLFASVRASPRVLPSSADWIPTVAPAFSARLFGRLALSGFGHRSVLSANFTLHRGLMGVRKNRRED